MEKEFNIFEEFDSVEQNYLKSLENEKVEDPLEDSEDLEDEEDLDKLIESKAKEVKENLKNTETDGESEEDDEEDDAEEAKSEKSTKDVDEDENDGEEKSSNYSFKALANYLADEGAIDYEDSEDEEDSPDVIANAVLNTAKNMLSEYKESLPDEGKKFLTYLEKGGDPKKYIEKVSSESILDLDITDTENQKKIIKEYLKQSDYTEEEIEDLISEYEEDVRLESQAKRALTRLEKLNQKEKENLIKQQELEAENRKKEYTQHLQKIEDSIETSDKIAGIPITKAEKKALKSYLLDADKDGTTQWTKDLKEGGIKTQLALAYLQMKKFDFSKLTKVAATEVTKKYKNIFDGADKSVKGRSKQTETTSDKGDFSAFKSFLK